jgi:hypothetical protein
MDSCYYVIARPLDPKHQKWEFLNSHQSRGRFYGFTATLLNANTFDTKEDAQEAIKWAGKSADNCIIRIVQSRSVP